MMDTTLAVNLLFINTSGNSEVGSETFKRWKLSNHVKMLYLKKLMLRLAY